jgi:hypothetical protein
VHLKCKGKCLRRAVWPHSAAWELKGTSSTRECALERGLGTFCTLGTQVNLTYKGIYLRAGFRHILHLGNSSEPQVQGSMPYAGCILPAKF